MTVGDKVSNFLSYWCRYKCPHKDCKVVEDDVPVDVYVENYRAECTCPKCGEEFIEIIDGSDIDYEVDGKYELPEKYCECCQVEKFVEELKYELR